MKENANNKVNKYEMLGEVLDELFTKSAKLFDIEVSDMFSNSKKYDIVRAQWLFWYAVRYLTHDTCRKIAEYTNARFPNCNFSQNTVVYATNNAAQNISSDAMWKKRWSILRGIIDEHQKKTIGEDEERYKKKKVVLVVRRPADVDVELKFEER